MPFGKYRGVPVAVVPTGYLVWLWEETDVRPPLADAIREELAQRLDLYPEPRTVVVPARPPDALRPAVRAVVRAGFRQLALDQHPDRGGSNTGMREVLEARAWLEALVS
jgi:hypothetical protein